MSCNPTNLYDFDPHIAEIYDLLETYHDDVDLLLGLIASLLLPPIVVHERDEIVHDSRCEKGEIEVGRLLRILEPFCGTGRILIPLAQQGHTLIGLDQAAGMLDRARQKLALLPREVQSRVTFQQMDIVSAEWPTGFDLVVLSGNCLYELATPEEQELVIRSAAAALNPGGYIYVDNDHMEGGLDPAWQQPGVGPAFPSGICADGTQVDSTIETIWYDIPARLVKFRRTTRMHLPSNDGIEHRLETAGKVIEIEYIQQKHPVSAVEVKTWLEKYGFTIDQVFGDRSGSPYTPASGRAIFWAHLPRQP
jgi:SAM-dependent methyltransferase